MSASYLPAPGAPTLPPTSAAAVAVIDFNAEAPEGVTETQKSDRYACHLRIAPPTRLLGTVQVDRHEVWTGQEIRREDREQKARDVAAAHGGNAIAWGCDGIKVLVLPTVTTPPAAELLAAVAKRARSDGFVELGGPVRLESGYVLLSPSPRTCYGVAFALEAGANWGLGGKRGLRFESSAEFYLRNRQAIAEAVPGDGTDPEVPFARARAGWQFLGCSLGTGKARTDLQSRSWSEAWGKGGVLVQLYSRPASGAEVVAAEQEELDRQRKDEERMRAEEACVICAQYRCDMPYCGEYDNCLARRGVSASACQRR